MISASIQTLIGGRWQRILFMLASTFPMALSASADRVDAYGEGVRYRSQSSGLRRYTLEVRDYSKKSDVCKEKYDAFWRSRVYGSGSIGGITGG